MNSVYEHNHHQTIVYDADQISAVSTAMFDPVYWQSENAVVTPASGRGGAFFIAAEFGPVVLRRYYRGGIPAKFSRERFMFTGWKRTRSLREFELLVQMLQAGLPVPEPMAAMAVKEGLFYRAAILLKQIEDVTPLADLLIENTVKPEIWHSVGQAIRVFHSAGLNHVDLNARNILVRAGTDEVFLVDFDRCRFNPGVPVDGKRELERLQRSLQKFRAPGTEFDADRQIKLLMHGYDHG